MPRTSPERCGNRRSALAEARPGDRIAILGARDDTLSEFAPSWSIGSAR